MFLLAVPDRKGQAVVLMAPCPVWFIEMEWCMGCPPAVWGDGAGLAIQDESVLDGLYFSQALHDYYDRHLDGPGRGYGYG